MEFRTSVPGGEQESDSGGGSSNDILEKAFEEFKKNMAQNPENRVKLASALQENYGIDPSLTSMFVPGLENDIENLQNEATPQGDIPNMESAGYNGDNQTTQNTTQTEMPEPVEITTGDIVEIVEKFQEYLGDDASLEEVKDFINKNDDIVQREIDEYL